MRHPLAIQKALRIARRYADGGDVLFDPTPMNPPKAPNQRVMEGHQEYEKGYGHVWGGRDRILLNSRGQYLQARTAADGGGVDPEPFEANYPEPEQEPLEANYPEPPPDPKLGQYVEKALGTMAKPPGPDRPMEPDLTAVQQGQMPEDLDPNKYGIDEHGRIVDKQTFEPVQFERRPNMLPFTKSGDPTMPKIADVVGNLGGGWNVPTRGAEAVLGAGLAMPKKLPPVGAAEKPPIPPQLHFPEWAQSSQSKGTGPGALFTNTQTGQQIYAKVPHSTDHLNNELMASKFYEMSGIPAAQYYPTKIKDAQKLAVASDVIPGKQLSEFPKADYNTKIKGLREGRPIDAFLANWDVVGAGHENPLGNIIVDANGIAHRIDFGGALRFGGMGGEKGAKFNANVSELTKMVDYGSNKTAASIYDISHLPAAEQMQILQREKDVAARVAGFTDNQITQLVYKYGPAGKEAKTELRDLLLKRRDVIAEYYGVGKHAGSYEPKPVEFKSAKQQSLEELQSEWEAKLNEYEAKQAAHETKQWEPKTSVPKGSDFPDVDVPPGGEYSYKNAKDDANQLLINHSYPDAKNYHSHEAYDIKGIAHDLYTMAEKNPEYVDKLVKEIPPDIYDKHIHPELGTIIQRKGDPWAAADSVIPAGKPSEPPLKLMNIKKTHSVDQIVNALKSHAYMDDLHPGKIITQKQKDNIAAKLALTPSSVIAKAIKDFGPQEQDTVTSWLGKDNKNAVGVAVTKFQEADQKIKNAIEAKAAKETIPDVGDLKKGHSLHQFIHGIKYYSPLQAEVPFHAYQSIPKELSKWSPHEIMQEMKSLNLSEKQKVMHWLPESTKEKMAQIGAEQGVKKQGFIPQEYYDALEPVDWAKYKPKGTTSVRQQFGSNSLAHIVGLGFNPDVALYKGGKYASYPQTILDPVTEPHRLANASERAFFLTHDEAGVAQAYGQVGKPYIARPEKVFEVKDYHATTGTHDYESRHVKRLIEAAREQGADLLIIHNIGDVASGGHHQQTQYAFLNTHVLRGPEAKFDPEKLHLRQPLAGLVGGGLFSYGMVKGQEDKEGKMARGGQVMPLKPGSSKAVVSQNISEFHGGKTYNATAAKFGKERANKQAIAVALSTARKYGKARGGISTLPKTPPAMPKPPKPGAEGIENLALKGSAIRLGREGLLNSSIPGRTDKLPMNVKAGSYVLPADIPSALGQGNTMAGGDILKKMFSSGPYGMAPMTKRAGRGRTKAGGGEVEGDDHVPIIAAGGEYIISPEVVQDIGHGNMKHGHDVLDRFVLKIRKHHIATLKSLPGPKT